MLHGWVSGQEDDGACWQLAGAFPPYSWLHSTPVRCQPPPPGVVNVTASAAGAGALDVAVPLNSDFVAGDVSRRAVDLCWGRVGGTLRHKRHPPRISPPTPPPQNTGHHVPAPGRRRRVAERRHHLHLCLQQHCALRPDRHRHQQPGGLAGLRSPGFAALVPSQVEHLLHAPPPSQLTAGPAPAPPLPVPLTRCWLSSTTPRCRPPAPYPHSAPSQRTTARKWR